MKYILALEPCENSIVHEKVMKIISSDLAEVSRMSDGEYEAFDIAQDLLRNASQIMLIYGVADEKNFNPERDYVGFLIFQLWRHSIHGYAMYVKSDHRKLELLRQVSDRLEDIARSFKCPYISFCTGREHENTARSFGYRETYATFRKRII